MRFVFLLFTVLIFSCTPSETPVKEVVRIEGEHSNGVPKRKIYLSSDSTTKLREEQFYATGELFTEGKYLNNDRDGEWKSYFQDGNPWSIHHYDKGRLHGEYKVWADSMTLKIHGNFHQGEKSGVWNYYGPEGSIVKTENYGEPKVQQ